MAERILAEALPALEQALVAVEMPPGIGKTFYAVRKALELAGRGHLVIFTLPNHSALYTAFSYAVKWFYDNRRKTRNLPIILYYQGMEKFCPFLQEGGEERLAKALDWMKGQGLIEDSMYRRLRGLKPREIIHIFSSRRLCRHACPIYKTTLEVRRERILVPATVMSAVGVADMMLTAAEKTRAMETVRLLHLLQREGRVRVFDPGIDETGRPRRGSHCLRQALWRGVLKKRRGGRKVPILVGGAVIFIPVQAIDFMVSVARAFYNALSGKLSLKPPILVVDEYDNLFYTADEWPLFTLKHLELELSEAARVAREEAEKRRSNDPSYDWERLVAALVAYTFLNNVKARVEAVEKAARERPDEFDPRGAFTNLFAEYAVKAQRFGNEVLPPLAPRAIVIPEALKTLPRKVFDHVVTKTWETLKARDGIEYFDQGAARRKGLNHFLQIWEYEFTTRAGRAPLLPALYRRFGSVVDLGYAETRATSLAKRLAMVLAQRGVKVPGGEMLYVTFRLHPVRRSIFGPGGRKVSEIGAAVTVACYDTRILRVTQDSFRVLLLSATGVPWGAEFVFTRSLGAGRTVGKERTVGSEYAIYTLAPRARVVRRERSTFSVWYVKTNLPKPIVVVSLPDAVRRSYASHGRIVQLPLPMLPQKMADARYYAALADALLHYVSALTRTLDLIVSKRYGFFKGARPAIVAIAQRKDVCQMFTRLLADTLKVGRLRICVSERCAEISSSRVPVPEKTRFSHYVLSYRGVEIYTTWLRSRMTRGVDLPEGVLPVVIMSIGSPYRPPQSIEIIPPPSEARSAAERASLIAIPVVVSKPSPENQVLLAHEPVDIAESVSELVQAVGRALRRAWYFSLNLGRKAYTVSIVVPSFIYNKLFAYSPLWFKNLFT